MLYVTLSSSFRTAIVALGGIGVIIYLTKKVKNAGGLDDDMLEDELAALLERERSNAAKEEQKRLKKQKKNGGGDGGSALPPLPSVDMTPSIMPKSSSLLRKKDTTTLTSTVGVSEVNPIAFHPDHNLVTDVQGPAAAGCVTTCSVADRARRPRAQHPFAVPISNYSFCIIASWLP